MAYYAKSQKAYRERHNAVQFALQYRTDVLEGKRVKAYLASTGQTANSYIKGLIKADLDAKGFIAPEEPTADQCQNGQAAPDQESLDQVSDIRA